MHLHRHCPATKSSYDALTFRHTALRCSCLPHRHSNVLTSPRISHFSTGLFNHAPYTLQTVRMASIFSTNGTYGVQSAIHWEHLDLHSSFLPDAANCSQRQMLNHYRTFLVYSNKCSTCPFTHSSSVVIIWTLSLTFDNPTCCPHTRIYVFCVVLRTKGDYFPIQH